MLKIDKREKKLVPLGQATVGSLTRGHDLGELIVNSPNEFFAEIGQRLFVVGEDIIPSEAVPIPIDLLALDRDGAAVIVVLQRGKEHSPLARAITCAGMIAGWEPQQFLNLLSAEQTAELKTFLNAGLAAINQQQRAVLVSETYDLEVLAATKWLRERYQMDNTCVRVSMSIDSQAETEYLGATDLSESSLPGMLELRDAPEVKEVSPEPEANRRKQPRTRKSRAENLRLEYGGQIVTAKLIDAGDGGLGAEMDTALQEGASVAFAGELHSPYFCMALHGRARVAHCRSREEQAYRVGLAFEDVKVKKLDCVHKKEEYLDPARQPPSLGNGSGNSS